MLKQTNHIPTRVEFHTRKMSIMKVHIWPLQKYSYQAITEKIKHQKSF